MLFETLEKMGNTELGQFVERWLHDTACVIPFSTKKTLDKGEVVAHAPLLIPSALLLFHGLNIARAARS